LKRSCNVNNRRGITLIEVVVSLVLLATLVAGMVLAYSAHHRQALLATKRQAAVKAADQLLTRWYAGNEPQVPRNGSGLVLGSTVLVWRTGIVHRSVIESLPVEVIRLQVFSENASKSPSPLAQVDVILPVPKRL